MEEKESMQKIKGLKQPSAGPDRLVDSWPPELIREYLSMNQQERQKNFASTSDTARWLGVSVSTVRNWCEEGKILYIRINGRRRIDVRGLKRH